MAVASLLVVLGQTGGVESPPGAVERDDTARGVADASSDTPSDAVVLSSRHAPSGDTQRQDFIDGLRADLGPHLHVGHARVRAVEEVIRYLRARYPDDWRLRLRALLEEAFPDRAAQLYDTFESLETYNEWLRANRRDLMAMDAAARRAALWQARRTHFGADAESIWANEVRNQQVADALGRIADNPDLDTPTKAARYAESVRAAYGERADHVLAQRRTELVGRFLDAEAVQADLRDMPAERRREALRTVRAELGMDAAALDRWSQLDAARDATWSAGQAYMTRRAQIAEQYSGAARQTRLDALRSELFGDDASVIAREEAGGFFRFAGERRIGRE